MEIQLEMGLGWPISSYFQAKSGYCALRRAFWRRSWQSFHNSLHLASESPRSSPRSTSTAPRGEQIALGLAFCHDFGAPKS